MNTAILSGDELSQRLETIAINAIIAAQMAKGRAHLPWIDDDTHRKNLVAGYLNLAMVEQIPQDAYHYQVVAQQQAPTNPKIADIERTLADALNANDEPVIKPNIKKVA